MQFDDDTSKNYTFHIVVVTFLSGNLKIMYRGGGCLKVMLPDFYLLIF